MSTKRINFTVDHIYKIDRSKNGGFGQLDEKIRLKNNCLYRNGIKVNSKKCQKCRFFSGSTDGGDIINIQVIDIDNSIVTRRGVVYCKYTKELKGIKGIW